MVAIVGLTACEAFLDIPDDPQLIGTQPWRCVGTQPVTQAPEVERVPVQVRACNFVSSNCSGVATGLTAKLCDKRDLTCSNPIRSDIADTNGAFELEVETAGSAGGGFDGYLTVSSTSADMAEFVPAMLFFNPPIRDLAPAPIVLPLFPTSSLANILMAAGAKPQDPARGLLFIAAHDCESKMAAGVTVAVDPPASDLSVLYVDHGVVSGAARQTDATGLAAISNVAPGRVKVSGFTSAAMPLRIGEADVQVASSTITYTALAPQR
jgi:hypothetical protein